MSLPLKKLQPAAVEGQAFFDVRRVPGGLYVTIAGKIDRHFDPGAILATLAPNARLVLDLEGIRSFTSEGVRAFERFVHSPGLRQVVLARISAAVAHQLTMIPLLCEGLEVESALLPFICESCGAEAKHLVGWQAASQLAHAPRCTCGAPMELDGLPAHYLPMAL